METTILSLNAQALSSSLNATVLREEARQRIEELASNGWTDYNSHDPGITILEVLAYAITDLGLRSQLDIEDYIAQGEEQPFFNARELFPTAPCTSSDFRRLLIDHQHVRNAWIDATPGSINGLYTLLLELTSDIEVDLNAVWLKGPPITTTNAVNRQNTYDFYIVFPYWEDMSEQLLNLWKGELALNTIEINIIQQTIDLEKDYHDQYFTEPTFTFGEGNNIQTVSDMGLWIRLPKGIPKRVRDPETNQELDNSQEEADFREQVRAILNGELPIPNFDSLAFFEAFQRRTQERIRLLQEIRQFILKHRNLCEDWGEVHTSRIQQIGLQIQEIEITPEADPIDIAARIYFFIEQFIDPDILPQSCEDLLTEGKSLADIFEGPLFENGFLPEHLLTQRQQENIYTSDLIRIIMQQPGVIGVNRLSLDHYLDRIKTATGIKNCLKLRNLQLYKPKLSIEDLHIQMLKRGVIIEIDQETFEDRLNELREDYLNRIPQNNSCDFSIPQGDKSLDISTFYSIQNDFPQIYGLKEGEITQSATPLRKAQAKQLKAYLLFFEQLMNNYCQQLTQVQELFSMRKDADRTYFYQPLYNVPAVKDLYCAFIEEQQIDVDDDGQADPLSWEEFKQNCNGYIKALDFATEDRETFLQRRNAFINHLLARFSEDFTDYAAWTFVKHKGNISSDLVFDKLDFLQRFPELSSQRAVAFDYTATRLDEGGNEVADVWNTENVSGFEKRVAAQLGIPDFRRRSLASIFNIHDYITIENNHFYFWNAPAAQVAQNPELFDLLLTSETPYSEREVVAGLNEIIEQAQYAQNYQVMQTPETWIPSCHYYFNVLDAGEEPKPIAGLYEYPDNRALVEDSIREVIHLIQGRYTEGMHLVEHILLRPIEGTTENLQPVAFTFENETPVSLTLIEDPYSFQVSIFLPGWAPRFQDQEFRVVVERKLRAELPAHIFPWIYWVELTQENEIPAVFIAFEVAFQSWLENFNTPNRTTTQNQLIVRINELVQSEDVILTNTYKPFDLIER